ncbi:putative vimentin [Escherichia coli]|uniref:Putative vimentin n=1 Tax=Escherichia coli TaxID=562 RepID=A0A377B7S7_ECOLX|nr:putative vimentin [Escherichia coli]
MYTQTLYELSQEAERLLQLSRQQLQLLEKMPLSVPGDDAPQLLYPGVSLISPSVTRC